MAAQATWMPSTEYGKFTIGPSCRKACLPFRGSAKSR